MNNDLTFAFALRDNILNLLSETELARVSTTETAIGVAYGDEYLDLEQLDHGVRRAGGTPPTMGRILPRTAVHEDTWRKILMQLTAPARDDLRATECDAAGVTPFWNNSR